MLLTPTSHCLKRVTTGEEKSPLTACAFEDGDFIIEGGPDTFLATKPWGVGLCKELGLGDRLHGTNPHQKNTYVLHKNKLQPLPDGLAMMIPTNIPSILKSQLVSWLGKARMGLDFLLPSHNGHHDESLGPFRLPPSGTRSLREPDRAAYVRYLCGRRRPAFAALYLSISTRSRA